MRARSLASIVAAAACAVVLLACTSSGDGGTGGTDDFLNQGAHVTSDGPAAGNLEYVDLARISGDSTSACIAVEAHRTFDVFNATFTLTYDPTMIEYASFDDAGTCMGSGAAVLPTLVDAATTPGQIVVGMSRNIANTSTGVTCGRLLNLCFTVVGEGDTRLTFTGNREIQDVNGNPIPVEWVPADLQTRQ